MNMRHKALSVHLLTAVGAVLSMLALMEAAKANWPMMFLWLVIAFAVDGIDGPLARKFDVKTNWPLYDGELMDLIVDYLTYVFIPAFALFHSGLLSGWTGWFAAFVITYGSVLYFSDTRMKTADNSFAGFPGCWNMVVLVLFTVDPHWIVTLMIVVLLATAMFTNIKFVHPVRTQRWRVVSLPVAIVWALLGGLAAWLGDGTPEWMVVGLVITSVWLLFAGMVQQIWPAQR